MRARIPRLKKRVAGTLLVAVAVTLTSCVSEKPDVAVVKDPDGKKESSIPWNKQEKWEVGADMSAMGANSDRR